MRLLFPAGPAGHMFQEKIDDLFSGMPNVFGIAHGILIAGFSQHGRDHGEMLKKVLWIFSQI